MRPHLSPMVEGKAVVGVRECQQAGVGDPIAIGLAMPVGNGPIAIGCNDQSWSGDLMNGIGDCFVSERRVYLRLSALLLPLAQPLTGDRLAQDGLAGDG